MPRSPRDMMAAVADSMKERTGRSLEEWVEVVQAGNIDPLNQNGVRKWLSVNHDVRQNSQWAIADAVARAAGWSPPTLEEYVDEQYADKRAALRPIFDRVREIIMRMGDDVSMEGRSSYIPFIRDRQFAAVAAATQSRVDVGVRFTDAPDSPLLSSTSSPGQATHKIELASVEAITGDVEALLRTAYEQNGPAR